MSNTDAFAAALTDAGAGGAEVTVDLTPVDYLDSAGLTALLPYAPRIRVIATAVLAPVLSVSGLDSITTVVSAPLSPPGGSGWQRSSATLAPPGWPTGRLRDQCVQEVHDIDRAGDE